MPAVHHCIDYQTLSYSESGRQSELVRNNSQNSSHRPTSKHRCHAVFEVLQSASLRLRDQNTVVKGRLQLNAFSLTLCLKLIFLFTIEVIISYRNNY